MIVMILIIKYKLQNSNFKSQNDNAKFKMILFNILNLLILHF
jgi:hypothetical protein